MPKLPVISGGAPALRILTLAACTMLLAACSTMRLQAPDVMPTSVELVDAQITGQRFKVGMHVQNPNDRALPIKSVSCALEIEGVEVGHGESSAPFNVPAHGESDFDMVVTTNLAMSVPNLAMKLFRGSGDLPSYRLSGTVNPDITLVPPIPFWKSGQIALPN
ncbi:MAG: LEA type 2 family protein [Steroidobacteraceae bacterium]